MTTKHSRSSALRYKARRLYKEASGLEAAAQEIDQLRKLLAKMLRITCGDSVNERRHTIKEVCRILGEECVVISDNHFGGTNG